MNLIKFKGVTNREMGVIVTDMPNAPSPAERGEPVQIPGRNGTLWKPDGAFEDIHLALNVWVPPKRMPYLTHIKGWLSGSGELEVGNSAAYYRARVSQGIEFSPLDFESGYTAAIAFECYPFRFVRDAPDIVLTAPDTVPNAYTVYAEPLFAITGNGDVEVTVGDQKFELSGLEGTVWLDTEQQECKSAQGLANHQMAGPFPVLAPGENAIGWVGSISRIVISPRWRML